MSITHVHTEAAPAAIGTYSQAVRAGDTVYLSGQIPLDPATMRLVPGDALPQTSPEHIGPISFRHPHPCEPSSQGSRRWSRPAQVP